MDPFNKSNLVQGNFQRPINNPPMINVDQQWGSFYPDGRPSWFERLVGKGIGVLKKLSMLVMAFAFLAVVFTLLGPFLNFLIHFSLWLTNAIDHMFF